MDPRQHKKSQKRDSSGFFDVPLIRNLQFANPIFARELRGKFRMRQPPLLAILIEGLLGLGVLYFYGYALWTAWTQPQSRDIIWWIISSIALLILMIACGVMGAHGFARERESGTWEGVQLSLLSASEILRGKIGGILVGCLLFTLPFWPLLLLCLRIHETGYSGGGVSLRQVGATAMILAATAWAFTVFGLWISWRNQKSAASSGFGLWERSLAGW